MLMTSWGSKHIVTDSLGLYSFSTEFSKGKSERPVLKRGTEIYILGTNLIILGYFTINQNTHLSLYSLCLVNCWVFSSGPLIFPYSFLFACVASLFSLRPPFWNFWCYRFLLRARLCNIIMSQGLSKGFSLSFAHENPVHPTTCSCPSVSENEHWHCTDPTTRTRNHLHIRRLQMFGETFSIWSRRTFLKNYGTPFAIIYSSLWYVNFKYQLWMNDFPSTPQNCMVFCLIQLLGWFKMVTNKKY